MDALILSCGTGGGHDSAGRAVAAELKQRGHHVEMFNPYILRSQRLAGSINHTYNATAQKVPKAFGAVYGVGNFYRRLPVRSPVYHANRAMSSAMQMYLEQNHFDIVIMPHLFPAEILTNMKHQGMPVPKTMFIATDYVCIPFTEETECDAYIIPAEDLTEDFTKRGIPKEKLYPLGIPTHSVFSREESQEEAKRQLGLLSDKKYILITGGSMGAGNLEQVLEKLLLYFSKDEDVRLAVVCGSNKALFENLQRRYGEKITLVGYTEQMPLYLKAAHLFMTKPGGLSSTEAAVCEVPIWHMNPIPGCETYNARYFSERSMSISCEVTQETLSYVMQFLDDAAAYASMVNSQRKYINKNAATEICVLAERMYQEA